MEEIRFDDAQRLGRLVSDDFGPFGEPLEVSQEMIQAFANLTGDHQWIHVDVERARRESPFGGPVAHGFLTLSLLPRMSAAGREAAPWKIVGHRSVVNYGSDKLRFLAPVPAGAKVQSRSRIAAVDVTPRGTRLVREIEIHVAGSERPALVYHMILLYR